MTGESADTVSLSLSERSKAVVIVTLSNANGDCVDEATVVN